jgi:hypothetical protein
MSADLREHYFRYFFVLALGYFTGKRHAFDVD